MNEIFFEIAYQEALKAFEENEIPVGAVIVKDNEVISVGHNKKEKNTCALYHAEMIAIYEATKKLKNWRLNDCDIYVTLEPCPMCASAIKQSRIRNIYCGLNNLDKNNNLLISKILEKDLLNPSVNLYSNLDCNRINNLMKKFFCKKRKN